MSNTKEQSINLLSEEDFEKYYGVSSMEYLDLMDEYNDGKYSHLNPNSDNYDEIVDKANPNYSEFTIEDGLDYAFSTMQVTEEEVGKDVYVKLLKEQLIGYIRSNRI